MPIELAQMYKNAIVPFEMAQIPPVLFKKSDEIL